MCDLGREFILCTCEPDEALARAKKPYWILSRKIPRSKDEFGSHIVGECSIDWPEDAELREVILKELRSRNCFDQNLNIKQKDKLDIVTAKETYSFELRRNGWQIYQPSLPDERFNEIGRGRVIN